MPLQSTLLTFLNRCYGLLLFAYPAHFRREYGAGMAQVFRDETRFLLQEGNTAVLLQFLLQTSFDLTKTVLVEHLEELFNIRLEGGTMSYHETVNALSENPEALEGLYHDAIKAGNKKAFQQAIDDNYQNAPSNLLLASWYHRLHYAARQAKQFIIAWRWVIPLALLNGLLFWWFSDEERYIMQIAGGPSVPRDTVPVIFLLAAPFTALFILVYFKLMAKKNWLITAVATTLPLIAAIYVYFTYSQMGIRPFQDQYLILMVIHLPVVAWVSVGLFFLANHRDANNRLRFLLKSVEVIVVGGILAGVLAAFLGITIGLFNALNVEFSENLLRLLFGGGLGTILVIAPAVIYNPTLPPDEQVIFQGFYQLLSAVVQVLLPLTFLVLIIYIGFIPANFRAPFDNRDVLITYNVMLFAVVGLLVSATILRPAENSPERDRWLRRLIVGVTILTLIVSLYALAAIIFRTVNDRLTPNRLAFMGWNIINIGLLALLLILQWRSKGDQWLAGLYQAFSVGTAVYAVWTVILVLALPWLFGVDQENMASLPASIQRVIYEEPSPVLLKCASSPHIYMLEGGEKRWIADIETFNERGYVWSDVNFVTCGDLASVPDGVPIPADAGTPPQP
ncbi:MAG: hypothetical protein H6657_29395 [Ardenticatenaceae bacterium]|nr:hypothetical protein [Ardenticatenaceae bacterium]